MHFVRRLMEMNDSELFPSPTFDNADDICAYNAQYMSRSFPKFYDPTLKKSPNRSSLSRNPLKISGLVDYETPKIHYKFIESDPKFGKAKMTSKNSVRKFTERQRREDMKSLYSSLRSLLPEEYVTGKCSLAEQLLGTANYIKDLQEKVKKATQVRDETSRKNICEDLSLSVLSQTFPTVKINSIGSCIEVSTFNCRIALSNLLLVMENNDLHVIGASSCFMNRKAVHTIHAKVSDLNNFDKGILYCQISNLIGSLG